MPTESVATLPTHRRAGAPSEPKDRTPLAHGNSTTMKSHRSPTILLVDDDAGVLESLRRILIGEGWRVLATTSGPEALAWIGADKVDLVITDLRMAPISGWDILYHERLERPHLPIFVITALPPKASGGSDTFAVRFFQKPVDIDALLDAIHDQLGTARSR